VATWLIAWIGWPLLVDPDRTGRPLSDRLQIAVLLILAHPLRIGVFGAVLAAFLAVSTVAIVALVTISVSFAALVASEFALPRGSARGAARPADGRARRGCRRTVARVPAGGVCRPLTLPIQVGPSTVTINRDDRVLVCQPDGRLDPSAEQGFFTRDTRFVSGWELLVNGRPPLLLNSSSVQFYSSRFEFTNEPLIDDSGPLLGHTLGIRLDRTVSGGVHEDLDIDNFGRRTVRLTIELAIASDFCRPVRRPEWQARPTPAA